MKRTALLSAMLFVSGLSAQQDAYRDEPSRLTAKGLAAYRHSITLAGDEACAGEPHVSYNTCMGNQVAQLDADLMTMVLAIGASARLNLPRTSAKPRPIALDDGEAAWMKYRDASCQQGTSSQVEMVNWYRCRLLLTHGHMSELFELYLK